MKVQRFSLAALVILGLVMAAGVAWGFVIENEEALDRVSQIVNLKGSSTTGEMSFSSLLRVMPNGTEVPFTIPAGHVLLITRVYFDLKTTFAEPWTMVFLEPFLYPAAGGGGTFIVNGNASGSLSFGSGCPIGPPSPSSPPYTIRSVTPNGGATLVGTLNVQIMGFLLNPTATVAPINFLLLEP
ncbi:MAG: hypothetical protein Q7O12_00285 [Deltaproteobacteria bacterium]|nr:hypothetical protein [Deltaproteobacteria bacterium]